MFERCLEPPDDRCACGVLGCEEHEECAVCGEVVEADDRHEHCVDCDALIADGGEYQMCLQCMANAGIEDLCELTQVRRAS